MFTIQYTMDNDCLTLTLLYTWDDWKTMRNKYIKITYTVALPRYGTQTYIAQLCVSTSATTCPPFPLKITSQTSCSLWVGVQIWQNAQFMKSRAPGQTLCSDTTIVCVRWVLKQLSLTAAGEQERVKWLQIAAAHFSHVREYSSLLLLSFHGFLKNTIANSVFPVFEYALVKSIFLRSSFTLFFFFNKCPLWRKVSSLGQITFVSHTTEHFWQAVQQVLHGFSLLSLK